MSSASSGGSSTAMVREGWDHLRAGRPLAAWASWQRALRLEDGSPAAAQALERLEKSGDLPAAARAVYRLRTPSDAARRAAWDDRLRGTVGGLAHAGNGRGALVDADLAAMADAFGRLAAEGPADPAAWFNRALCLAWLGSNREAIAALDRAVELEAGSAPEAPSKPGDWLKSCAGGRGRGPRRRPAIRVHDRLGPGRHARAAPRVPGDPAGADAAGPRRRSGAGCRGLRMAGSADAGCRRSHSRPSRDGRRAAGRAGGRHGPAGFADAAALQPAGGDAPAGRGTPALAARDRRDGTADRRR